MKLSLLSEYALLSLIHVARQSEIPATSIKDSQQIPSELLNEILATLVDARYLRLRKGSLSLAKSADKIHVIDIIRLFDGALAPIKPVSEKGYQPAPMEREEKLTDLFTQLQSQIVGKLENTSLADLV
jgi:Rrf2 family transcriptional regulator, cysteine metabolism repressor